MNTLKFRPVGKSGPIVKVRVSQSKRAIYSVKKASGEGYHAPLAISVKKAVKLMDARGFVRAGVRHG
ncbi:hypothetical protein [Propionivibrio dicarboxylicus]|uniref:Uncharacterized protein n=1 Tax=Propionivibrio dicarboxylicus TaxID=83767 RepID=A0A1G8C9D6_9RHOO|nr:hypothetical protein [Propionivibrio dicarboxylicus]SDH42008.1 hypothetical protein SAMN05660652_01710 [Propionivibrio dicarboxylicus]